MKDGYYMSGTEEQAENVESQNLDVGGSKGDDDEEADA